jgi:hypothetical protein
VTDGPRSIMPFGRFDPNDPLGRGYGKDFSFTPEPAEEGVSSGTVEVPVAALDPDGVVTVPAPHPSQVSHVLPVPDVTQPGQTLDSFPAITGKEPVVPEGLGTDDNPGDLGKPIRVPDNAGPSGDDIPVGTGTDGTTASLPALARDIPIPGKPSQPFLTPDPVAAQEAHEAATPDS